MTARMTAGTALASLALVSAVRAGDAPAEGIGKWITPILADRARVEVVDWFEPKPGAAHDDAQRYTFFANQLRFGAKLTVPHLQAVLEGQDVRLVNLPDDASLPPPTGNLGPGALYFFHSHGQDGDTTQGETTLRQGYATIGDVPRLHGLSLTGGRFEYSDGLETVPADPSLAWLKRARIAERLVGPFNYTHIGRSFDGGKVVWDGAAANLTAVAFHPTHGGFETSSTRELGDVFVSGLAATLKQLPRVTVPVDLRAFYLYYEDRRFSDHRDAPPLRSPRASARRTRSPSTPSARTRSRSHRSVPARSTVSSGARSSAATGARSTTRRGRTRSKRATSSPASSPNHGSGSATTSRRATTIPATATMGRSSNSSRRRASTRSSRSSTS